MQREDVERVRCANCGADLSVIRMAACCSNPAPSETQAPLPITDETEAIYRAEEVGRLTNHCSEDGGLPDVGLSLGLGDERMLFVGDAPDSSGTALVIYDPHDRAVIAASCDREKGFEMLETLGRLIMRLRGQVWRREKWLDSRKASIDALLDRAERAEAERDAAFAAGQEEMRERAASANEKRGTVYGRDAAAVIRDLPIKDRPDGR